MFDHKINEHVELFNRLKSIQKEVEAAGQLVQETCLSGRTVFSCGNGGSAGDAQHFAAELTGRYITDRPSYAGVALTVDTSALTSIGNDYGYEYVFSRQLEGLGKPQDVLLAISTSGNSKNVIQAVKVAQSKSIKVIGLLGRDGGELKDMTDITITIPSNITARIQEAHIFVLHYLCDQLEP